VASLFAYMLELACFCAFLLLVDNYLGILETALFIRGLLLYDFFRIMLDPI